MQTTPVPTTQLARSTVSFDVAMAVRPEIPSAYPAPSQADDGRFVQPEFEKAMQLLGLRGQISDRILNIEDAEGEALVLDGEIMDLTVQLARTDLSDGVKVKVLGNVRRRRARVAYLQERRERWRLELKALKALLMGATSNGV
jgi:hypothetical protein